MKSRTCSPSPWMLIVRSSAIALTNSGTTAEYCDNGSCRWPEDVEVAQRHRLEPVDLMEAEAVALGCELRDGVRRQRRDELELRAGKRVRVAVDRRRGSEDDTPDALVSRREKDVERSLDVDGTRRQRIVHGARNGRQRPEVEDDLGPADGVVDALVAAQVAFDDLDVVLEPFEVGTPAGGEVVEHPDVVALLQQRANEVRPDESCTACDENAPCHSPHLPPDRS